jgi:hypothetical protein
MGPRKSKPEPPPREVVEEETSNGFHVFELHMPTMGANVVLLLIVVLAAIAVWRLRFCKSLRKRRGSRKAPPSTIIRFSRYRRRSQLRSLPLRRRRRRPIT